ncbi:sensor histidine kinase [Flavobacterium sp.]
MKFSITFVFMILFLFAKAQNLPTNTIIQEFIRCENKECQVKKSFLIAESYLELDGLKASQKWLDITKNLNTSKKIDTTNVFIHSLQSELFYYNGLFQFGINEAEKVIANSILLKDSLLISNGYFFKGINLYELNEFQEAQKMLWKSKVYQPRNYPKKQLRDAILKEHIFNNLAQVKQQLKELDSAIWYNSKAYFYAKKNNSKRGIPNIEQTYSLIFLDKDMREDAIFYLNKSTQSAKKNDYYDIVLANYGYLIRCYPNNASEASKWFDEGLELIKEKKVNISYQVIFYKTAIKAFKINNQLEKLAFAQEQLLTINKKISLSNNDYIQNITKQYVKNENKMLKQELNLTKSVKERQIFYFLFVGLVLVSIGLWYFFKQRQSLKNQEIATLKQNQELSNLESLIDGEENERKRIAQELHDGLNGDLSAIKYRLSTLEESGLSALDTENIGKVIIMIDDSCTQIRSISHNLMPSSILDYGLIETIKEYLIKINASGNFRVDFQFYGTYRALSKKNETVIYRIIQELVTNILKHAKATEAMIQLNYREEELVITVEDNAVGFDLDLISDGIGHKNIQTRIAFLNAQMDVDSSVNGTFYTITIDLNKTK